MLNIDYAEGLNLSAKVSIGSIEDLDCTLLIANNSFPQLDMGDTFFNRELREYFNTPPNSISCISQHNIFTLYNNESAGSSFIPEFIISGRVPESVNGVDISLGGLYSFFDGRSSFEVKDSCICKNITDCFVKTQFFIAGELYYFSVEHDYAYSKKIDTTTLVEDAIVRIWKPTGDISFDEIKSIVKKIRVLFSLLLGFDLSIKKTWLISADKRRSNPFYFYAPSKSEQPFEHPHECFIYSAQLLTDENWANMLTCTFNNDMSPSISDFWVRLVSMFSYTGFWEYEILGVVSLLDAYSKNYHKMHTDKKMPERKFKKLKDQLKTILCSYKDELPLDKNQPKYCEVIDIMTRQLSYIKNTNAQDFRSILNILMENINDNIKSLIGFRNEDFEMIIKIRNLAAHGSPIDDDIMENIQRVMIVKEKIKFLLLYIFFISMKFSDNDFVNLCMRSFSRIKLGASLDSYILNVVYGTGVALNIDTENFNIAKEKPKSNIAIIFHIKSGLYELNNAALNEIIDPITSIKRGMFNVVDLIYSTYANDGIFSVEYLATVFLCNENERIELHGVYLIKSND